METVTVKMEKSGRILIPAAIRRKLHLEEGATVVLRFDGEGIQIGTRRQVVSRVQERLRKYIPKGRVLSDELLQERRKESARESGK